MDGQILLDFNFSFSAAAMKRRCLSGKRGCPDSDLDETYISAVAVGEGAAAAADDARSAAGAAAAMDEADSTAAVDYAALAAAVAPGNAGSGSSVVPHARGDVSYPDILAEADAESQIHQIINNMNNGRARADDIVAERIANNGVAEHNAQLAIETGDHGRFANSAADAAEHAFAIANNAAETAATLAAQAERAEFLADRSESYAVSFVIFSDRDRAAAAVERANFYSDHAQRYADAAAEYSENAQQYAFKASNAAGIVTAVAEQAAAGWDDGTVSVTASGVDAARFASSSAANAMNRAMDAADRAADSAARAAESAGRAAMAFAEPAGAAPANQAATAVAESAAAAPVNHAATTVAESAAAAAVPTNNAATTVTETAADDVGDMVL